LEYFDNDSYATTGELFSLYQARAFLDGDLVIAYGDVIYDHTILQNLLNDTRAIRIAADAAFRMRERSDATPDLIRSSGEDSFVEGGQGARLERAGSDVRVDDATGDWVGLLALRAEGSQFIAQQLDELAAHNPELLRKGSLVDLLNLLVEGGREVGVVHTYGHWRDLDSQANLLATDVVS
jgi:choline kinase